MVINLNAVSLLGKVFPSLQYFSTFSPRMYCSVAYWQSYVGGAGMRKQATFLNVGKPQSKGGGAFEKNFARFLAFTSPYARSQAKTGDVILI